MGGEGRGVSEITEAKRRARRNRGEVQEEEEEVEEEEEQDEEEENNWVGREMLERTWTREVKENKEGCYMNLTG